MKGMALATSGVHGASLLYQTVQCRSKIANNNHAKNRLRRGGKIKGTDATNELFLCLSRLRRLTTCASYIPQSVFSVYV